MSIKAIFFDAAGTLIRPARRVGENYAAFARKHGLEVAAPEIFQRFRVCFADAPPLAFPGALPPELSDLERAWWKNLVARVFEPWGRFDGFDACFGELFDYFAGGAAWSLYPEVEPTLASLKQRGILLDVISNFDSRLHNILAELGIARYFDGVVVSSAIGHAKPDRRIFQAVLDRHGLSPTEAAHVGDSETNDVAGARDAGLKAILVDRSVTEPSPSLNRVSSLDQILPLLFD